MKPLENKKVLVVDDEDMLREVLCDALTGMGAEALSAANGTAGLELVRSQRPDLVITDLRMPGGDGKSLLAAIQKEPPPRPRIIICTAFSDIDESGARDLGAYTLFTKPFDWRKFRETVIGMLTGTD